MYTLNYNNFTLVNDSNHTIEQLDGITAVDIRTSSDFLTGADGGNVWARKLAMRIITIGGSLFAPDLPTYYSLKTAMMQAFPITNTLQTLTITKGDGTVKTITAKVTNVPDIKEQPGEGSVGTFQTILTCENPYFSDGNLITGTTTPTSGGGSPVPMSIPTPIGNAPTSVILANAGDIAVYPVITITGPISFPVVYNSNTNQSFQINTTIAANDYVSVYYDTTGFWVIDNATGANYYQYFTGAFTQIQQGNNTFILSGTGTSGSTLLTVSYYQQYLNL